MAKVADPAKVITGKARSTMMFVTKFTTTDKDGKTVDPHVSTGILIPKKDKKTIKAIEKAIEVAAKKKGLKVRKGSSKFNYPLRDCDVEIENGDFEPQDPKPYKNMMYVKAKAWKIPGLVDASNDRIEDVDDRGEMCVSGFWFRFSITFKGFINESEGVRVELNNMMFVKEDERLDGGASAESDFENYAIDDDDDDDDDDVDDDDDDDGEDEKPSRRRNSSGKKSRRRK